MKKIVVLLTGVLFLTTLNAQDAPVIKKKEKIDLSNRPNDHLMIQFGMTNWIGTPDTINTKGLSKSFNAYFMFDFPFKTNPHLSIGIGPGIGTDHILFTETNIGIKERTNAIRFTNVPDTNHFKKTKLATIVLEAPIELRYSAKPETGKGIKAAIGVKVGTLLKAYTRNTKFQNKTGNSLGDFVSKESSNAFFNKTRISASARFGLGHISLFANYQLTSVFKDGLGPDVRPFSIGIALSGL